ncbi:hypothetical protein JX265_006831 [Neoarthrinium moseri]|uniref:Uncharacterized protein n=1 Tax=Neoarthrinium moseri TaxID=1658444 RepID=A0A9Q0AQD1_9PEZI|nr:hypothetical protein JX265_006831 [Neoarthrinium moseri]
MVLSITSMCAIVVLLAKVDNIPLQSWWLPIQPNSVIAILTTVGKAALMVPVASSMSQLKWIHFLLRPRRLVDLQLFDEASRGPWGSAVLLCRLFFRPRVFVALGFAFVTIVAMGIDATAQQVLDFSLQETALDNMTTPLGVANNYFSKGFIEKPGSSFIWQPNVDLIRIQSAILNGASGSLATPYFDCPEPAERCSWEPFTTLGVCADFKNITEEVTPLCVRNSHSTGMNCTYTSPESLTGQGEPDSITMHWDPEFNGLGEAMLFQSVFKGRWLDSPALIGSIMTVKALNDGAPNVTKEGYVPPPVDIGFGVVSWCVQTFHNVTATPGRINPGTMTSERLGSMEALVNALVSENKMDATYYRYHLNSTGASYNLSRMVTNTLPHFLDYVCTATIQHQISQPTADNDRRIQLAYTFYQSDIAGVLRNISNAITNQMRSSDPGDNYNATVIQGKATFNETYIRVRWPWMILPLAETALAAVLLAISIIMSRHQPLLKTSVIAYLTSRLEGWADEELDVGDSKRLTQEKLEELAEGLRAQLEANSEGRLAFRRKEKLN